LENWKLKSPIWRNCQKKAISVQTGAFHGVKRLKFAIEILARNLDFLEFYYAGFACCFSDQWRAQHWRLMWSRRYRQKGIQVVAINLSGITNQYLRMCLLCQISSDQAVVNCHPRKPSQNGKIGGLTFTSAFEFPGASIHSTFFKRERSAQSLVLSYETCAKKLGMTWVVIKEQFPLPVQEWMGNWGTRKRWKYLCRWMVRITGFGEKCWNWEWSPVLLPSDWLLQPELSVDPNYPSS